MNNVFGALSGAAVQGSGARYRSIIELRKCMDLKRFGAQRQKQKNWSGRADLNCRPLAPQASALPG
jgi:hypothetical protein